MKNNLIILLFISISISLIYCNNKNEQKKLKKKDFEKYYNPLIRANKYLIKKDAERIESYAKRRNWDMKVSKTGLYYQIYEQGSNKKAQTGMLATLSFEVSLLDGTHCYSSDSIGNKVFEIGHGRVESGLEQGLLLLNEGDKARFIMPPYMAHGLLGDQEKITARSIIVYDIHLIKLSK